ARRLRPVPTARRAGPARGDTDVRVQVVEVARLDRAHRGGRARLLGAARLRRERLGRALPRAFRRPHGMTPSTAPTEIERFDRAERLVHWTTAVLVGVLILTGACLYLGELEAVVGRRELVRTIHVAAVLGLPVPLLLGLLTRAGRG